MKLKKRASNGIYMLYHEGRRISTGERLKSAAERAARIIIANGGARPTVRGGRWTLREALTDTYERIWQHQKGERETRYKMEALRREYGHLDVTEITYAWLSSFVESLRSEGKSAATINRKLSMLRVALREAHKMGLLDVVPPVPFQCERKKKLRWLTPAEQHELAAACADLWPRPEARFMESLIHGLIYTGARVSEYLKACQQGQFDGERMYFYDTKNGTDRSIPLRPEVLPWIRISAADAGDYTYKSVWRRFDKLTRHAGFKDVTLHTLRHTCASRMVQAGVDLYRVGKWLGHTDIKTTQIYAHLAPESLDTAAAHLVPPVEEAAQPLHSVRN